MKWNASYVQKQLIHLKRFDRVFEGNFMLVLNACWRSKNSIRQIATTVHEKVQVVEISKVVLGLATSHDENSKSSSSSSTSSSSSRKNSNHLCKLTIIMPLALLFLIIFINRDSPSRPQLPQEELEACQAQRDSYQKPLAKKCVDCWSLGAQDLHFPR